VEFLTTHPSKGKMVFCAFLALLLVASTGVAIRPALGFQAAGQLASVVVGQPNFVSSTQAATTNHLFHPFGVAFDHSGDLWVADEANHRVSEFKPPIVDGESASLEIGAPSYSSNFFAVSGNGVATQFTPVRISFDSGGDLWVSDTNSNRILEFKPPFSNGMNASLELGQQAGAQEFTSNLSFAGPNGMSFPVDMKFDSSGDLWVSDRGHNRVLEFKPPFADGMDASIAVGQPDLASVSPPASPSQTGLLGPNGIAFDQGGNLWVADQNDNRVLKFAAASLTANGARAELEIGQPVGSTEFTAWVGATSSSGLSSPLSLAFDPSSDLWVSDRANNRILEFTPPFSNGMNASVVVGQPAGPHEFTDNSTGLTQGSFWNPLDITFDEGGDLWVADQSNNRVLQFNGAALATAGVNVDVPTTTDQTAMNVSGTNVNACYRMAEQAVCHLAASRGLTAGVQVDLIGIASGPTVNIYSSYSGPVEPAYAAPLAVSQPSFYSLAIAGIGNGTATVCVGVPQPAGADAHTGMAYFSDGRWGTPSSLSRGASAICGTIPLSALEPSGETPVIAVGGISGLGSSLGVDPTVYLVVLFAAVLLAAALAVRRRASSREAPEEELDDQEDEGWGLQT